MNGMIVVVTRYKLKGFDIHPYASICCLADVYDALTGKRSYKKEKTPEEALKIKEIFIVV